MNTRLAVAAALVASVFALSDNLAAAGTSPTVFIPPKPSASAHVRRAGGHYSTAIANQIRQCNGLSFAYDQAVSGQGAKVSQEAQALHDQGVAMCAGGARTEGITNLSTALRDIGVTPRVY